MDFDNRKVYGDTSITDGLVFTLLTLFTSHLFSVYTIQTDLHCLSNNMYAYVYCYKVRALLGLGFRSFSEKCGNGWTG